MARSGGAFFCLRLDFGGGLRMPLNAWFVQDIPGSRSPAFARSMIFVAIACFTSSSQSPTRKAMEIRVGRQTVLRYACVAAG